jgi:MFS family permease
MLNFLPLSAFLGGIANGYDGSLISSLAAIPQWYTDLSLHDTNTLGLVIAAYSFGGILTISPAPWVTDRLGRRWSITIVDIGTIGASAGQGVCTTAVQFLATRLIIGCSSLFISISTCALLAELAHPRQLLLRWLHHSRMDLIWIPRYRQCLGLESPHWCSGTRSR